jgi:hypothetical protein
MSALSMPKNIRTRATLLASWYAAQKVADTEGGIVLNHASAAGMLLDQHRVVAIATKFCPPERWWDPVRRYLTAVAQEEGEAER